MNKKKIKHFLINYLKITFGVMLIAFSYYFFFSSEDIVTGGVTGLAIILRGIFGEHFSPTILIYIVNLVLLVISYIFLGRDFFLKTVYGSLLLPTFIGILEFLHVPNDCFFKLDSYLGISNSLSSPLMNLLCAIIVGSIASGIGLGLCFRNNATTGGTDVIQKLLAKYLHIPYSFTVYLTDGIICLGSLFVFGFQKSIFSLLTIFVIGLIIDYVSMGGKSKRTAFIISSKEEEIQKLIIDKIKRGVTVVPAEGGFSGLKYRMLVCTLSKKESYLLRDLINQVDPGAFTFYVSAKEVFGDGF